MNLSAEQLNKIEKHIINSIKSVYLLIETSNHMHCLDNINYLARLDDNSVDVWIHDTYRDDVFSLSIDSFGYYVGETKYSLDITDSGFDLENDFFQISTVYPFQLSTYLEIRKLRMDMIEKEILYKV